jgi:hypothetical protein
MNKHRFIKLTIAWTWRKPPPSMPGHKAYTQMSFCFETPKLQISKFSKFELPQLWRPITSCINLWLKWGLKQSCSLHRKLSNDMWHATFTQVNQGEFWFLMVKNQIGNLTSNLSFGIIYVLSTQMGHASPFKTSMFQKISYGEFNELFNLMSFDPWNCPLKIPKWELI